MPVFPKRPESESGDAVILVTRVLDVIEHEVVPATRRGVAAGNKLFGAAVLARSSLEPVVVGTNREVENPLWHGEVSTLNAYWALSPDVRPPPAECIFVSTHEPCSLCLSAITWSGFDRFVYLFSYEDSRDAFAIPHDLRILEEVFGVVDGAYRRTNAFWTAHAVDELVAALPESEATPLNDRVGRLRLTYAELSAAYQATKGDADIPLE